MSITITRKQAKPILDRTFPDYSGRKIKVVFVKNISFYNTNWAGGSRNQYAAISADGKSELLSAPAPWQNFIEGTTFPMPEEALIVMHSIFCGRDTGIVIYAHPCHMPKWIDAPKGSDALHPPAQIL